MFCNLDLHFSSDAGHPFTCLLAIHVPSLDKCLFRYSAHFFDGLFIYFDIELSKLFLHFWD